MDTKSRRQQVLQLLKNTKGPVTGSNLAKRFNVSRQIIVGDISVLRAGGITIYATPQGYVLPEEANRDVVVATITCQHDNASMLQELETVVDNGGFVRDVIVEHPLYGEIRADLMLGSRHDVQEFYNSMLQCEAKHLSLITNGVHLHTIEVPSEAHLQRIRQQLKALGVLAEEQAGI